jgi:hypothetical protein
MKLILAALLIALTITQQPPIWPVRFQQDFV